MHDPEARMRVAGLLAAGYTPGEVSRQTGVPRPTVIRWRDDPNGLPVHLSTDTVDRSWLPIRGATWQENFQGYIDDVLYGLRVQAAYLSRPDVMERTDYGAIVDAHGTLADRVARIAEAVGRVETPAATDRQLDGAVV